MLRKKYLYFSFLIFIFLIICSNGGAESKPSIPVSPRQNNQYPTKGPYQQSYKNKYSTESLNALFREINTQEYDQNIKTTGKQKHHWYNTFFDHTTDWLLVLFSFLLVVVTGFLVIYNYRLWKANAGLLEVSQEQSRDMKESLNISRNSANAAQKSADFAEEALHISERAYLTINYIGFKKPWQIDERVEIEMKIINRGRTPAHLIEIFNKVEIVENLPETPIYSKGSSKFMQSIVAAGNQHTIQGLFGPIITQVLFDDIMSIKKTLYVWGRIIYQDVFKKQWVTAFGAEHSPHGFLPVEGYDYIAAYEPEKEQS